MECIHILLLDGLKAPSLVSLLTPSTFVLSIDGKLTCESQY